MPSHFRCLILALVSVALLGHAASADEGMWTFDNPPTKILQDRYKFVPSREWLDHVRLASVRLNDGGSGSFVSPHGLLLTNHHVASGQLQKNSTPEHDYLRDGFYAATAEQEMKSPDLEVNVLIAMENVTDRIQGATKGLADDKKALALRKEAMATIERESLKATGLRSDVVTLYQGGEYWLYRYKKYTDVRLVFAPEQQAAFFGGDPDNFTYPRYDVDMALFRVYENGKPLETPNYLKWNAKGADEGELVFVSGHPGGTSRLETLAQLLQERDIELPVIIGLLDQRLQTLHDYSSKGEEQARQAHSQTLILENSRKAYEGRYQALLDKNVIDKKQSEEADFRKRTAANADWQAQFGNAWDMIAGAETKAAPMIKRRFWRRVDSQLISQALLVVQYVAEIKKPDGQRLDGFHEAQLESLRYRLFSPAPIYPGMEEARIAGSLTRSAAELGSDDEWIKSILGGRTPAGLAADLVKGTKLADPSVRKSLVEGGEAMIAASTDPAIVLARKLDPFARELIKWLEDNVQSVEDAAGEKLGKARFLVYGKSTYPDATFTLRLSFGTVSGYPMNGTKAPYKTTFYGLYDRAQSFDFKGPFSLSPHFKDGREKLDLSTPVNFVNSCDIIGGNSGSPVINKDAELVGLIFDGNIESLAGDYVYDGMKNRAVAVHSAAMIEVLRKLYGAGKLAEEIQGAGR